MYKLQVERGVADSKKNQLTQQLTSNTMRMYTKTNMIAAIATYYSTQYSKSWNINYVILPVNLVKFQTLQRRS